MNSDDEIKAKIAKRLGWEIDYTSARFRRGTEVVDWKDLPQWSSSASDSADMLGALSESESKEYMRVLLMNHNGNEFWAQRTYPKNKAIAFVQALENLERTSVRINDLAEKAGYVPFVTTDNKIVWFLNGKPEYGFWKTNELAALFLQQIPHLGLPQRDAF